jgi:hypothetical protein
MSLAQPGGELLNPSAKNVLIIVEDRAVFGVLPDVLGNLLLVEQRE